MSTRLPRLRHACLSHFLAVAALSPVGGCASVVIEDRGDPDPAPASDGCQAFRARIQAASDVDAGVDVFAAAAGPGCSTIVGGTYFGDLDLAGQVLPRASTWNGWVGRFDGAGHALWSRRLAGAASDGSDGVYQLVSDASGDTWVTGYAEGALDLGGGESLAGDGSYLLALDPDGATRWAKRLPAWPGHLGRRSDGSVSVFVVEGDALEERTFDGATGAEAVRVLGQGAVGVQAGASSDAGTALVLCAATDVVVGGQTVAHGDETPDGQGNPTCDLVVVRFAADGAAAWMRTFHETGFSPYSTRVAMNDRGDVALLSSFWGTIDLGQGPRVASPIGPGLRLLFARFDDRGDVLASAAYGEAAFSFPVGVVLGAGGTATLGGMVYDGTIDFEGHTVVSEPSGYVGFATELDPSGGLVSVETRTSLEGVFETAGHAPLFVERQLEDGRDRGLVVTRGADPIE